jgi:hypothetical protein
MSRGADLENCQLIAPRVEIVRQHRNCYRLILNGDGQIVDGSWRIRPNQAGKPRTGENDKPSAGRMASSLSSQNIHSWKR